MIREEVSSFTATPGLASWNPPSRGTSQVTARVCRQVIASTPSPEAVMSATALRSSAMASLAAADSRSPARVSRISRPSLRKTGWPIRSSSALIW
jgi:hypothetical protein